MNVILGMSGSVIYLLAYRCRKMSLSVLGHLIGRPTMLYDLNVFRGVELI